MQTVPRTQTAFRLKDSLLEQLKWHAKRQHKSLNTLVEEHPDIEGSAHIAFAYGECCDVIVTSDKEMLAREVPRPMKVLTPEEFVDKCRA